MSVIRKYTYVLLSVILPIMAVGQKHEIGLFLGTSNYTGDLSRQIKLANSMPAVGLFYRNNLSEYFSFRTGINVAGLKAADSLYDEYKWRNLQFRSIVVELSNIFELNYEAVSNDARSKKGSFFVFTGFNIFYFNPQAKYGDTWVDLQPLGTEGQNIAGKDQRYSRISVSIPMGAGYKWKVSKRLLFTTEVGFRWSATDYLDDVSGKYPDLVLLNERNGEAAVALSDRSAEIYGTPQSTPDQMRGDKHLKDWYLLAGFTLAYRIPSNNCTFNKSSKLKRFFID